jgi:hypothetical protein
MAKLSADVITSADIERYISTFSDFGFELAVLNTLASEGLHCRHAGTYEDPVTRKTREFDIQAETTPSKTNQRQAVVRLAIECKNLRPNFPLVLHRVPRADNEAFTDVVWSTKDSGTTFTITRQYGHRIRLRGRRALYVSGEPVAKAADQVGKRADGELVTGDQDVFDRISQALHSSHELLRLSHYASLHDSPDVFAAVIPLLVVPNDRLWAVDYDETGRVIAGPSPIKQATYFVDRDWSFGGDATEVRTWYSLSHLEICEAGSVAQRVGQLTVDPRLSINTILEVFGEEAERRRKKRE